MKLIHLIIIVSLFISLCILISFILFELSVITDGSEYLKDVSNQMNNIFQKLDINNDGFLDITEFSSLKKHYKVFVYKQEEETMNYEV